MDDTIKRVAGKISEGGSNIIFTGAGISTESGISDYRSKGGIWDKFRPVYFDEFMTSKDARTEYWRRKRELMGELDGAQPNPAHIAVAELYEKGLVEYVITQNIDGLHQKAGMPEDRVIELHGNTLRIRCMTCGDISPVEEALKRFDSGDTAPECKCGGYLKPDTISFGQAMPVSEVEQSARLSRGADFFMVVGSTLLVQPASLMPVYAKEGGAFLAIVNLSETPCDSIADALINGKAGDVLSAIAERL
jgi:NAD-dependent deacetylase